jgi:phage repressor protein C with HTH and peptisase S24 domain
MYPTLKNGSLVMVNRVEQYTGDGIYVFRFDGQLMVKRLQFSKTGLGVVSDNSTYEKWELTKDEIISNDFEIIGEVVWSGQRM